MARRIAPTINELAEMMLSGPLADCVGYNEMAGRIYVTGRLPWADGSESRPWAAIDDSQALAFAQDAYGASGEREFQHALNILADRRRYNPVADLLRALPAWDGQRRAGYLASLFLGARENEYTYEVERLFMRAALARTYRPGCKFDYMPVYGGAQGIGKSTFLRFLALRDEFFTDAVSGIGSKQAAELVQGKWVVEVPELAAMRGIAVENVKAFVTRQSDDYRAPYARHAEARPRRFVVAGTTNALGFLTDPTGNRRFLPVRCGEERPTASLFERGAREHIEQAWAEVLACYRADPSASSAELVLPASVAHAARECQDQASAVDGRIGIIADYLDRLGPGEYTCVVKVIEEALGRPREQQTRREQMEVSELLHSSFPGWVQLPGKRRFGAYGIQRAFSRSGSCEGEEEACPAGVATVASLPSMEDGQ